MKKTILSILVAYAFMFVSCSGNAQKTDEKADDTKEQKAELAMKNSVGGYGKEITPEGAISLVELKQAIQENKTFQGKVQGSVNACCQNKGCWMKMDAGDGETMMVTFKDYGFFVPKDFAGTNVVIQGNATMKEISVEELKHLAMDAGKTQAEIDAITEPKQELVFVADGVLAL
jgi:hypothetical protein